MPALISHSRDEILGALNKASQAPFVASDVETADKDGNPSTKYWEDGFQVTHYGACWDDDEAITFDPREFPTFYAQFLRLPQVVHNAGYEGGVWPRSIKIIACTQIMAKLENQMAFCNLQECARRYLYLPPWKEDEKTWDEWAERNSKDVVITWRLYGKLRGLLDDARRRLHDEVLLPASVIYAHIPHRGLRVDCDHQRKLEWEISAEANSIAEDIYAAGFARSGNLASPKQMESFLYDQLQIPCPPRAVNRKTGSRSTSADFLAELALAYPVARQVRMWRKKQKLKSTYIYKDDDGNFIDLLHPTFNITGTIPGRASSQNPNGQNFPRLPSIRQSYRSQRGVFLNKDGKQIELVIFGARLAGDPTMVSIYTTGGDIHTETCLSVVGALTEENRTKAKTLNFSLLYGGKAPMLQLIALKNYDVVLSDAEAYNFHLGWFTKYYGVRKRHRQIATEVLLHGIQRGPTGRVYDLNDAGARSRNKREQEEAVRCGYNYPTQGAAFDMTTLGLIELDRLDPQAPALTVHDSVVADVPEADALELSHEWEKAWTRRMDELWPHPVPITIETSMGPSLGELKKR